MANSIGAFSAMDATIQVRMEFASSTPFDRAPSLLAD